MARNRPGTRRRAEAKAEIDERIQLAEKRQALIDEALQRLEKRGRLLPAEYRKHVQ